MRKVPVSWGSVRLEMWVHDPVLTRLGRLPDFVSKTVENTGRFFEEDFLSYLAARYPSVGTFVDVGANIGNHSLFALEALEAKEVVCFEPDPTNFEVLQANVGQSGAICHNVGLSDKPGTMEIVREFIEVENQKGTVIANQGATHLIPGKGALVRTLDSYNLQSCDILKIDVEGMEPEVLKGSSDTVTRLKPTIYAEAYSAKAVMDQMAVLAPLGYVMTDYRDFGSPMACYEHGSCLI